MSGGWREEEEVEWRSELSDVELGDCTAPWRERERERE